MSNWEDEIKQKLEKLDAIPERNPLRVQSAKKNFMSEMRQLAGETLVSVPRKTWWNQLNFKKETFSMKLITIATILSLLLGGGITAVAAQDSLPGDLLYPVKTLVEDIELGLATDPETEFDVAFKHTIQRAEEIQQIIEGGIELPKDYPLKFQFRLNRDIEETIEAALATEDPTGNLLKLQEQLAMMHKTQQMNQGEEVGPFENKNSELYKLQYYMELIDAGIEEPELLASELEFMATFSKQHGDEKLEDAWMYLYMNMSENVEGNIFSQQTQNQGEYTQIGPFEWMHQQGVDVLSEIDPNLFRNFGEDKNSTYDHLNAGDNENGNNGENGGSGGNGGGNGGK